MFDRETPSIGDGAGRLTRIVWIGLGLFFTGLGFAGLVLPLLPGTPFFLLAAYSFARSSPRLLAWLLSLPKVGPALQSYRAGLGIPRRVKWIAAVMASTAVTISAFLAAHWWMRVAVLALGAIGVWYVLVRVPTREAELERRRGQAPS
jgi:uncharacterized protein